MVWIKIDRNIQVTLAKQIFEQIRNKILRNELKSGEKLPSSRSLARELNVSRNTIIEVYDQLSAEGYLVSRGGSGSYIADNTHLPGYKIIQEYNNGTVTEKKTKNGIIDFNSGIPDLKKFPRGSWSRFLRLSILDMPEDFFNYGEIPGISDLRVTLSTFLLKTKGIMCHPDQIIILTGSSEGFLILGRLLKSMYNRVVIEDPVYGGIQNIFKNFDIKFYPVPVDDRGMETSLIPDDIKDCFIAVTPSHQFPTGSVLPIQRRVRLIELAKKLNTYIIENDYDSEFRYRGSPISSLHLLSPDTVIHVGTFSESLYPSLRLAYMVLPEVLVEDCCRIKESYGLSTSSVCQLALSNYIKEGYLQRHVSKMKKLYNQKRKTLVGRLEEEFKSQVKISGDSTGLFIVAEFYNIIFTDDIIKKLLDNKVRVYRVEDHSIVKGKYPGSLILGYGNLGIEEIVKGIEIIKRTLNPLL